jgi:hypothetical protein
MVFKPGCEIMIRVFLVLSFLIFGMSFNAWSEDSNGDLRKGENTSAEASQKAKKRLYPGGRDEEDLKVQAQLPSPSRKLSPQAEMKEETVDE